MGRGLRIASGAILLALTACGAGPAIRVEPRVSGYPAVCAPARDAFERALAEARAAADAGRGERDGSEQANLKYWAASRVVEVGLKECFSEEDAARVERERRSSICTGRRTCPPMPFSSSS